MLILCWGFFSVFFFCECGTILTAKFATFDYELWQCDWYLFPYEMQRILTLFMSNTQNPATLFSYGNFECTRDTFKRVICLFFRLSFIQIISTCFNCLAGTFCIVLCVDNQSWLFLLHDDWWNELTFLSSVDYLNSDGNEERKRGRVSTKKKHWRNSWRNFLGTDNQIWLRPNFLQCKVAASRVRLQREVTPSF